METLILAIILILIVLYIVVWFLATDRFYRKWESEYAEMKRRKEETLQKRSLVQPNHCPHCGEVIPPASSDYTDCPKCGRVVMTIQDDHDGRTGKRP
jgi:predicted RNA-binding Zn-ribbon protein involved in translation (DUF1610 family)